MTDDPRYKLDYATPVRQRDRSILKWILFAFAVLVSLVAVNDNRSDAGGVAGGLWIAFALIHVNDFRNAPR
jgi:hypothetical protein